MKIFLMYNYNLVNPTIYKTNKQIYIKDNNKKYILCEIISKEEIKELYIIINKYIYHKTYNKIIPNKNNEVITTYKNRNYVLIEIMGKENIKEIRKIDNIYVDKNVNYLLDRSNWYFLWCKKNDYIESDYKRIEGKYATLDECIDYYIGLGETAISYLNTINNVTVNSTKCISHKRIDENSQYNPLNIIIDSRERDVSEYMKYLFFNQNLTEKKLKTIISYILQEKLSAEKIYSRLLYPTYFFDIYESLEENEKTTSELIEIIKKVDAYELFLINFYNIISKKINIKKIDWLN